MMNNLKKRSIYTSKIDMFLIEMENGIATGSAKSTSVKFRQSKYRKNGQRIRMITKQ